MSRTMKLSDIKIKESFAITTPKEEKMNECRMYWNNNHEQDRYIVIDYNNTLVDGYIQYLVLKEMGEDMAEIQVSNTKKKQYARKDKGNRQSIQKTDYRECETTYIFGVHPNSKSRKERVWRVPNSWWRGWTDCLNIGDMLLVETKYGLAPIEITGIERLNKCPIDIPVKKVVKKLGGFEK